MLILVLVLKDSLRTFFKSLSLSWSLGVRSLSLSWSLGVRSLSLSWSLGVRSLSLSLSLGGQAQEVLVLVLVLVGQVLVLVLVLGGQVLVNIPAFLTDFSDVKTSVWALTETLCICLCYSPLSPLISFLVVTLDNTCFYFVLIISFSIVD